MMKNYSLMSVQELLVEQSTLESDIRWEERQRRNASNLKEELAAVEVVLKEKNADATAWWK